jgi:hypothetical protein
LLDLKKDFSQEAPPNPPTLNPKRIKSPNSNPPTKTLSKSRKFKKP